MISSWKWRQLTSVGQLLVDPSTYEIITSKQWRQRSIDSLHYRNLNQRSFDFIV
jgi:hypothetical protein